MAITSFVTTAVYVNDMLWNDDGAPSVSHGTKPAVIVGSSI